MRRWPIDYNKSKQQFIAFIGQRGIKTKNYIGTIVFKGEQINIFPKMFREDADYTETENLTQKHRSIITDLLDEDMTWDIMMERYHVSHTMIAKYRKAALKELDKQYELRDRQVEAFVLG